MKKGIDVWARVVGVLCTNNDGSCVTDERLPLLNKTLNTVKLRSDSYLEHAQVPYACNFIPGKLRDEE